MVGVRVISVSLDEIEIDPRQSRVNAVRTVLETLIPDDGTDAEREKIAAVLGDLLQLDIEVRKNVDDPDMVDEETLSFNNKQMEAQFGEVMRYEREGPDRFLVSTEDIITVTWDATAGTYQVSIRVARR